MLKIILNCINNIDNNKLNYKYYNYYLIVLKLRFKIKNTSFQQELVIRN